MKPSISRIVDAVAIAPLVFTAIIQTRSAFNGSPKLASLAFAFLCAVFAFSIWKGTSRIKRWAGVFLIFLSLVIGLFVWRFHIPLITGGFLIAPYLIPGALMIGMNIKPKVQQSGPGYPPQGVGSPDP